MKISRKDIATVFWVIVFLIPAGWILAWVYRLVELSSALKFSAGILILALALWPLSYPTNEWGKAFKEGTGYIVMIFFGLIAYGFLVEWFVNHFAG